MVKVLITAGIAASLFVLGLFSFQNQSKIDALEKSKDRGKLKWYVEMAKARGNKEISFTAPIAVYGVANNLDEAVIHYSVVIAEPIEQKFYVIKEDIRTWYRMRIIEKLSEPTVECRNCFAGAFIPADMLPVAQNEVLVEQQGGEAEIDGVRVISKDYKFPRYELNKRYLLFLTIDTSQNVAACSMGPWGVFKVDSDETFKGVEEAIKHPIKDELEEGSNSVGKLRIRLNKVKTTN